MLGKRFSAQVVHRTCGISSDWIPHRLAPEIDDDTVTEVDGTNEGNVAGADCDGEVIALALTGGTQPSPVCIAIENRRGCDFRGASDQSAFFRGDLFIALLARKIAKVSVSTSTHEMAILSIYLGRESVGEVRKRRDCM